MIRHSLSTSFVPSQGKTGEYIFYVTVNRWEDDQCVTSKTILEKKVRDLPEASGDLPSLEWVAELADMAWTIIVAARSAERAGQVRGSNPLWPDTTGKPLQL